MAGPLLQLSEKVLKVTQWSEKLAQHVLQVNENLGGNLLIPKSTDFRLVDRFVIDHLLQLKENVRMFRGMIDWFGFPTAIVHFEAPGRFHGIRKLQLWQIVPAGTYLDHIFLSLATEATGYAGLLIVALSSLSLLLSMGLNRQREFGLSVPLL